MRFILFIIGVALLPQDRPRQVSVQRPSGALSVEIDGREALRYQMERPADGRLSVESACYFHPMTTPSGVTVTDAAPDDHRHHRGIFLAFVEMHGRKDADFWGWGQHAPKEKRLILNREAGPVSAGKDGVSFSVTNDWRAEDIVLVEERTRVSLKALREAHVLDLVYTLTAPEEVSLSRWAFSGFCVRTRKDGKIAVTNPDGPVNLPAPNHMKPESDWPDAAWYDYSITLKDGAVAGVAVINHPKNPPTLWHNATGIGMLNPCIVAPGKVMMKAKEPLVLRYRVVTHDGAAPKDLLNVLSAEWNRSP